MLFPPVGLAPLTTNHHHHPLFYFARFFPRLEVRRRFTDQVIWVATERWRYARVRFLSALLCCRRLSAIGPRHRHLRCKITVCNGQSVSAIQDIYCYESMVVCADATRRLQQIPTGRGAVVLFPRAFKTLGETTYAEPCKSVDAAATSTIRGDQNLFEHAGDCRSVCRRQQRLGNRLLYSTRVLLFVCIQL